MKSTRPSVIPSATLGRVQTCANWMLARKSTIAATKNHCGVVIQLMNESNACSMGRLLALGLQGSADAAVLPDAPEVDGHQDHRDDGHRDAVQHVEAEQRLLADEPAAEQRVADVVARVD